MSLKSVLREPLLHFLVIGAALFAYSQWSGSNAKTAPDRIVLTAGQIEQLVAGFTKAWKRAPTDPELKGMIDDWVREELAVRSALESGLDRGDLVIRRRLRQKFEFFVEDMGQMSPPTENDLMDWYAKNADIYRAEPRTAFRQIYFSKERRGANTLNDAKSALERIAVEQSDRPREDQGDTTLLPNQLDLASQREIDQLFGSGFGERLAAMPTGRWSGPIESAYGLHLVLILQHREGQLPGFSSARAAVERDFITARRKNQLDFAYEAALKRYSIVLEAPDGLKLTPEPGSAAR